MFTLQRLVKNHLISKTITETFFPYLMHFRLNEFLPHVGEVGLELLEFPSKKKPPAYIDLRKRHHFY